MIPDTETLDAKSTNVHITSSTTEKKVSGFPVPSRDVTNQTGRIW